MSQMDEKTALNGYLYAAVSQKHFSKSKILSLSAAQDQKFILLRKILFAMTAFLTFPFRSKCPMNTTTSVNNETTDRKPILLFES